MRVPSSVWVATAEAGQRSGALHKLQQLVRVLRVRLASERQWPQAQHAQIGLADLRGVKSVGHLERDRWT